MAMTEEFIGRGVAFPMRVDSQGRIALVDRDTELVESIRLILGTTPGERPMRPEFGCAIHDYVFAPADATTGGRIKSAVEAALERWEPRIDVLEVSVDREMSDPTLLMIDIVYRARGTNDPRNLVFPFYTIPAEE
jgi:phage baseplate assembly protein W